MGYVFSKAKAVTQKMPAQEGMQDGRVHARFRMA